MKQLWVPDVFFRNEKGAGYHFVTQSNVLCYIENGQVWHVSKCVVVWWLIDSCGVVVGWLIDSCGVVV